jgi:LPXTG-motif cell wall-anchored protein
LRKVMLLAAMLAMVLAAGAPAFAQTATATATGSAGPIAVAGSVQYVDCDQIQAALGQYENADASDFSAVADQLGVSQNQVLACFGSAAAGRDINVNTASPGAAKKMVKTVTATATATATASGGGGGGGGGASALPSTGGVSVPGAIALGAGVLLVAGGLLARRIVR